VPGTGCASIQLSVLRRNQHLLSGGNFRLQAVLKNLLFSNPQSTNNHT
jgi:hypothetical protein